LPDEPAKKVDEDEEIDDEPAKLLPRNTVYRGGVGNTMLEGNEPV
jgi:hypothetical protein